MIFLRSMAPLYVFMILTCLSNCGGNTGSGSDAITEDESINTEKLIGTPFEGLTNGDDFHNNYFFCGRYRTTIIDSFPIYIFSAFFTPSEEVIIQEGIDLANTAIGYTAYALTSTWSDNVRVIYKVNEIAGGSARGQTYRLESSFEGGIYAFDNQIVDWAIEVTQYGANKWTIAHEIGHSTELEHSYFNYDSQEWSDLEENSIMKSDGAGTELTDYNEMMNVRGQIMQYHLGQEGVLDNQYDLDVTCDYYGLGVEQGGAL